MELRLTLVDCARAGVAVDVVITAAPATTLGAVRSQLAAHLGRGGAADLFCGDRIQPDAAPLGLPPLIVGTVLSTAPMPPRQRSATALSLHVVDGPDAGRILPLPLGMSVLGRSASAGLRINDPDISRRHTSVVIEADDVRVRDLGSTNGTLVDGEEVPADGAARLTAGRRLAVGSTTLVLRSGEEMRPAATVPDGEGHLLLNRAPRLGTPSTRPAFDYPCVPSPPTPTRLPWLVVLFPLLLSVPVALIWRQPTFLLFSLMTPLAAAAQYLGDRRGWGRRHREAVQSHEALVRRLDDAVARALREEVERRERAAPDLALLAEAAGVPTTTLWQRRIGDDDALVVRVGRAIVPAEVVIRRPDEVSSTGGPAACPEPLLDAPATVDLRRQRVTGIAGSRRSAVALARSLVGQVVTLCAPGEVALSVLTASDEREADWRWTRWLPHRLDGLATGAVRLVVLDGVHDLRRRPDVMALLRREPGDTVLLCLDDDVARLPVECTATLALDDDGRLTVRRDGARDVPSVAPAFAPPAWASRLARALAPLRDGTPCPDGALPADVDLLDLLARTDTAAAPGVRADEAASVAERWRRQPRSTTAVLGVEAAGTWAVDLSRDGPHALVAGTTGSGKSALLVSLVVSLCSVNRPDELAFVLVDYKGGAAFTGCADLPHVTGVVTDLDAGLTRRALTSLRAELRRRERLLHDAGAADLDAYLAARDRRPGLPPLPRLVLVVDEFRVLAEELPDFVTGLVRIAAVGRSLGVHLVLATQRPAGVVSADIRANANLRIALRVRDAADSQDVVDGPQAASLPAGIPGRAVVGDGTRTPRQVQVARLGAGGGAGPGPGPPIVRRLDDALGSPSPAVPPDGAVRAADDRLAAVARALADAATSLGAQAPAPPWLPPLPEHVPLVSLTSAAAVRPDGVVVGLADHPAEQAQRPWVWDLTARTNVAVVGGPRSGRSTAARSIAVAAGAAGVDVYVVDCSGALADLHRWPHVGAVVPADDAERCARLLDLLTRQRDAFPALLVVDGWESVAERWGGPGGNLLERVTALMRDGPASGVLTAVTGGRAVLGSTTGALLARRLVLPLADPADALLAGVRLTDLPAPRQGLAADPAAAGTTVQVAVADDAPCPAWVLADVRSPARVPALPVRLRRTDLARLPRTAGSDHLAQAIGVGAVQGRLTALGLRLAPPGALVVGEPFSGRTTTLGSIAAACRSGGRPCVDVGPDADPRGWNRDTVMLVDDAALLTGTPLEDVLTAHAVSGGHVVAACTADEASASYRGLIATLRATRTGVVLGTSGGEALGTRLPRTGAAPPGRGWLVRGGRAVPVQVSLP